MVASIEAKPKVGGWVRIEGGYGGQYNGRPAKILSLKRSEGAALLAISDDNKAWFAREFYTPITQAEAIALQKQLEQPDALSEFLAEVDEALGDSEPYPTREDYKVGDLLGVSDGHLAIVEAWDRDSFTILVSNGKRLSGDVKDLKRWGYQKIWSKGDRVTPKHNPGSRIGTIIGFNLKNKKTPLLVRFDGEQAEGKWGKDAVVRAEQESSALTVADSEIVDAEILPSRAEQLAQCEARLEAAIARRNEAEADMWLEAHTIRDQELWQEAGFKNFEEYCQSRWGWQKSNSHEVAGAGEVIWHLKQSGVPDSDLPKSLAAIRPLRKVKPEMRLKAIEQAKAETGKLTGESVKQAIALLNIPAPKPLTESPFDKGDFVEGRTDEGRIVQGYISVIGPGYVRLEDNTAIYDAQPVTPTTEHPDTWKQADSLKAAGVQFREVEIPRADIPGLPGEDDEPTEEEKILLSTIQDLARHCSESIYKGLIKLGKQSASILELTEEIESEITEMLESRLLGG